ncbi:S53 family peptidase [Candidatus Gottesmanbacteria bacterium]|nr:S53 family peptidase [Candidatus Gottesmanbacteria bacterium]
MSLFPFVFAVLPFISTAELKLPTFDTYVARPPLHIKLQAQGKPVGLTPDQVKAAYHLPAAGGAGTIAIVDAFDYPTAQKDLAVFSKQFHLPECQTTNGCLEIINRGAKRADTGWNQEAALDIQWAHAIAPGAKILLVESRSASGRDFLDAVDYARRRNPVAISLSWGGPEFPASSKLDVHFTGVPVYAAAGDSGSEVEWPAVSAQVVAVGGTTLTLGTSGTVRSETAWEGSGGGLSKYVSEPDFQRSYQVPNAKGHRAVPDVSFNADPETGFAVYTKTGWAMVGGTSAGAPQWAAIAALGQSATNGNFYRDAATVNYADFFRDVRRGTNGSCKGLCSAGKKYDYVTGLGSPQTVRF